MYVKIENSNLVKYQPKYEYIFYSIVTDNVKVYISAKRKIFLCCKNFGDENN
jgi:hypothetical protein